MQNRLVTILLLLVISTGVCYADNDLMTTIIDNVVSDQLYKPCVDCYDPNPTPAPVYTPVGVDFMISNSQVRAGQPTTITGFQTSGTTLGDNTWWQYTIQSGSEVKVLNGQSITFKPKSSGKTYYVALTARDSTQMLNGYIKKQGAIRSV